MKNEKSKIIKTGLIAFLLIIGFNSVIVSASNLTVSDETNFKSTPELKPTPPEVIMPVLIGTASTSIFRSESSASEADIDFEGIDKVISGYKNDINEINAYIEDYIKEQGSIDKNFKLPKDLQAKFDDIANEIEEEIERISSTSWSGKNYLVVIPYIRLWPLDFGVIYRVWTDHFLTQLIAKYSPLGISVIAIILRWAFDEGYYNELTLIIAAFIENMEDLTPERIRAKDYGWGVRWDLHDSYLYSYPRVIDSITLLSQL